MNLQPTRLILALALSVLAAAGARAQTCDLRFTGTLGWPPPWLFAGCTDPDTAAYRLQSFWINDCTTGSGPTLDVVVLWFQDTNGDGTWSTGDAEVARDDYPGLLWPYGRIVDFATIRSGLLPDPALPLWVIIDPDNGIAESDESNNATLVGYACATDASGATPMPDLIVRILGITYRTTGLPPGEAIATVDARLTNVGATDPAMVVQVLASCAVAPPQVLDVLAPAPGGSTDFSFDVEFTDIDYLDLRADWTGTAPGLVDECDETNNDCLATLDPATHVMSRALPVGAALRATGHSPAGSADVAAGFDWSGDEGAPRPPGDSFEVFTSASARRLDPVSIASPLREPRWTLVTPRRIGERSLHFVLVAAADEDGQLAE